MKNFLILGWALFLMMAAKPFKNENLNPAIQEPQMPGTSVEVKEFNPSPNPTAGENQSDVFRGSTINLEKSDMEKMEEEPDLSREKKNSL
jgi:hypothetical protein